MFNTLNATLDIEVGFTDDDIIVKIKSMNKDYYSFDKDRLFSNVVVNFIIADITKDDLQFIEFKEVFRGKSENYSKWLIEELTVYSLQYFNICNTEIKLEEDKLREKFDVIVNEHTNKFINNKYTEIKKRSSQWT